MEEETKDIAFELARCRLELDAARKVIAAAREAISEEHSSQIDRLMPAIAELRAAIALYDVILSKATDA